MIITSKLIPKGYCVNLFGTFWTRNPNWIDKYVINHERIHTAQQRELLFIPFYIVYLIEWVSGVFSSIAGKKLTTIYHLKEKLINMETTLHILRIGNTILG